MPEKHPNAQRWGGPGASRENRDKPPPDPTVKDPTDRDHLSRHTQISGGGGETDVHGGHAPEMKRNSQASSKEKAAERGDDLDPEEEADPGDKK